MRGGVGWREIKGSRFFSCSVVFCLGFGYCTTSYLSFSPVDSTLSPHRLSYSITPIYFRLMILGGWETIDDSSYDQMGEEYGYTVA